MLRVSREFDEALARLRSASSLDPANATILTEMGAVLLGLGRTEEGKEELELAIEVAPDHVLAYLNVASACIFLKQFEEARDYLIRAQKRAPRDTRIQQLLTQIPSR